MNKVNNKVQNLFKPILFYTGNPSDNQLLKSLIEGESPAIVDEFDKQLAEHFMINNLELLNNKIDYEKKFNQFVKECADKQYGLWVFYPWKNVLVHTLEEKEFVELRTNRNKYKITDEEQQILSTKVIGIVGLSVGREIAITAALERICGEIRLADFDIIELANLNRLKVGIDELGVPKVISAARQISEIDPFIKVKVFADGLTQENMDEFFDDGVKIDLFFEESDGFDIKVLSRYKARNYKIPVVMETNDRGMLDIERFDVENFRPLFHGFVTDEELSNLTKLSGPEQLKILQKIVSFQNVSDKMKHSFTELGKSIKSWPQLGSDISFGAGMATGTGRMILLGEKVNSGRYYIEYSDKIVS
ncbi:MAG: ThiF family adenylyltransferase [Bacteroidota bacterium]